MKRETLAFIPAREGSKRIKNKNTRLFLRKPLIAHTIEHALRSPLIDRTIVCTESPKIAAIAKKAGAEVPFLRPKQMASDKSNIIDSILYTLAKLKKEEGYVPTHFVILQGTSPLREQEDIAACFRLMKKTNATTVLTVAPTHPILVHLSKKNDLIIGKGPRKDTSTHAWNEGFLLNGCTVYVINTKALLKEKRVITKRTKAVIMPKWRSVDLDEPEEWAMAEVLYKNKKNIRQRIKEISS